MIYLKRIGYAAILSLIMAIALYFFLGYLHGGTELKTVISIRNGDTVTVSGTDPMYLGVYATNADQPTIIKDLQGNTILATTGQVMDGYFDAAAYVHPGTYKVFGHDAVMVVHEGSTVSNPDNVKWENELLWSEIKMGAAFTFFFVLFMSPWLITEDKKENE